MQGRHQRRPWRATTPCGPRKTSVLRSGDDGEETLRGRVKIKMKFMKLSGQSLMARDFDRQVAEIHVRIALFNGDTAPGMPITEPVG